MFTSQSKFQNLYPLIKFKQFEFPSLIYQFMTPSPPLLFITNPRNLHTQSPWEYELKPGKPSRRNQLSSSNTNGESTPRIPNTNPLHLPSHRGVPTYRPFPRNPGRQP